jgi:hypothetical protein
MACPNVSKVSRKSTEEGHTEERMEKGEFSNTSYITRGGLKREKTMHFQGSHNSNDSHDDRELHEDASKERYNHLGSISSRISSLSPLNIWTIRVKTKGHPTNNP